MKTKIIYLIMILLLVSCGSSNSPNIASDSQKGISSQKITVPSILSNMEKGKYKDGEILVKFKAGVATSSSQRTIQRLGARTVKRFSLIPNLEKVKLPDGVSVKDAITTYMSDPNVEYAEPNYIRYASFLPNDTFFSPQQWALRNDGSYASGTAGDDIKAAPAWDITTGSSSVVIAVIDSGIDYNHPDFVGTAGLGNIWTNPGETCSDGIDHDGNGFINDCRGWNFVDDNNNPMDDFGHGTHVAGIIGAAGNNSLGIAGVMWQVKLIPLKILDSTGTGTVSDSISAIQYVVTNASKGIKVINASYGGFTFSQAEFDAISGANAQGILFVAAAGNGDPTACAELATCIGLNSDLTPTYPASYNILNVISVAATDQNDMLASFSNFGNSVHVAAPGVHILSTIPTSGLSQPFLSFCTGSPAADYDFCGGTSMAAPHVSGLAGLLYSFYDGVHNTQFNYWQVRDAIFWFVDYLGTLNDKVMTGGRITAYRALSSLLTPTNLVATPVSSSQISLTWSGNATGEEGYQVERQTGNNPFAPAPGGGTIAAIPRANVSPQPPVTYTFVDNTAVASTPYTYRVYAFNNKIGCSPLDPACIPGRSFYSNVASATTPAQDTPPSDPPSSGSGGGGGGGCSIGARQNTPTAVTDLALLCVPLLLVAILRRRR
ncbi:MAG TPA: S8 family serine peptidase [Thermodesulfovibrionales bacterium]|nr:S8 family serine peptidase [Thermodesulfovibrionales bacterium]